MRRDMMVPQKDELAAENVLLKMRTEYLSGELTKLRVSRGRLSEEHGGQLGVMVPGQVGRKL